MAATEISSDANNVNTILIHADANKGTIISPEIYGHFAEHLGRCVYEGFWVGPNSTIPNTRGIRNDVIDALKKLNVPVIRWPGGCFADEYHWKDGVGPIEQRPLMVNTHWGMVTETNRFGTHEFMDLCEMLGCTAVYQRQRRLGHAGRNAGLGRVYDVCGQKPDGGFTPGKRTRKTVEGEVFRRRQRKLGLRREYDGGILR